MREQRSLAAWLVVSTSLLMPQILVCAKVSQYSKAAKWLAKFQYIPEEYQLTGKSESELQELISEPLRQMKRVYGFGDDDILDHKTLEEMSKPRCGEPDSTYDRKKRWTKLSDSKWGTDNGKFPIKIGFTNYLTQFSNADQETVLMECARLWSSVSGLSFQLVRAPTVPWIRVQYTAIDGPWNTVGNGLSPTPWMNPPNSYLKLDNSEKWVLRKSNAIAGQNSVSLQAVICHEMGHNIGLGHTNVRLAIMYPTVGNQPGNAKLDQDDINGVKTLYPPNSG